MSDRQRWIAKGVAFAVWAALLVFAGAAFSEHRNLREAVVPSPALSDVKTLGDYFAPLKGTINDCYIYVFDSGQPGGTLLLLGGTHPEEPGASLTAQVVVETLNVEQGKIIVAIHANRSASTVTRPGDAYPRFFHIDTPWGVKQFRMGDRWSNPLDSWPDPEVYIHYPSSQQLAYMDVRNLNRVWPGRANGTLTEQTTYAFMNLIRQENVDVVIDLHEAELEYPVIGTIVANQNIMRVAALASMELTSEEFPIGMEFSPVTLHGLSHREIGDHSQAGSLLFEAPEPFLDRVRGITDEALLLTGKDEFVMKAGEHKLLYWPIDENGWPIDVRVGRHLSSFLKVAEVWTLMNSGKPLQLSGVPRYAEVIQNGIGYYLHNPQGGSTVYYE